jgi:hypothetical protein
MRKRLTTWAVRLGLPTLALPLAVLLAACAASQTAVPPAVTATSAPVSTFLAAPSAIQLTSTAVPTVKATAAPAITAATQSAPAATRPPAGPTVTAGPQATATTDPAVAAVLAYLDARARTDVAAATSLSCKTWKSKAVTEVTSFRSMNAKLVGVTCQVNGSAGSFTLVGCGGKMVTTYGTETRDWDLSTFVYQVAAEDGQWKMCGYH